MPLHPATSSSSAIPTWAAAATASRSWCIAATPISATASATASPPSTCAMQSTRRSSTSSPVRPARAPFICRPTTICCWRSTRRASGPCRNSRTRRPISAARRRTSSRTRAGSPRASGSTISPSREAQRDRLHAGRRPRAAPHLVHRRPLRLCLHPLRRFHRPYPRGHRHVRPAQAAGRRPLLASRHVACRRRDADLARGQALLASPCSGGRQSRLRGLARRRPHGARRRRSGKAQAAGLSQHGPAVRRRHAFAAAVAGSQPARPRRGADLRQLQRGAALHLDVRRPRAEPIPSASRPFRSPRRRTIAPRAAASARTICTRTGPARSRARAWSSPPTTMPACAPSISRTRSNRAKSDSTCRPIPPA